jgi:hypothetical protein
VEWSAAQRGQIAAWARQSLSATRGAPDAEVLALLAQQLARVPELCLAGEAPAVLRKATA